MASFLSADALSFAHVITDIIRAPKARLCHRMALNFSDVAQSRGLVVEMSSCCRNELAYLVKTVTINVKGCEQLFTLADELIKHIGSRDKPVYLFNSDTDTTCCISKLMIF